MPTYEFPSLYQRATLMLNHCDQTGVKISRYWQGYVENVILELSLIDDDIFSHRYFFAATFGGGDAGIKSISRRNRPFYNASFPHFIETVCFKDTLEHTQVCHISTHFRSIF